MSGVREYEWSVGFRDIDITLDESTRPGASRLHWTSPRALGGLGGLGAGLAFVLARGINNEKRSGDQHYA